MLGVGEMFRNNVLFFECVCLAQYEICVCHWAASAHSD